MFGIRRRTAPTPPPVPETIDTPEDLDLPMPDTGPPMLYDHRVYLEDGEEAGFALTGPGPACGADAADFTCNRPEGHFGVHVESTTRSGRRYVLAIWPGDCLHEPEYQQWLSGREGTIIAGYPFATRCRRCGSLGRI